MEHWRKFWRELRRRPIATTVSALALFLVFHLPAEAVESWINEQLADLFGITKPTMGQVLNFTVAWGSRFIAAAAVMIAYHAGQPVVSAPIPAPTDRNSDGRAGRRHTSLEPWFLAAFGFAIFATGETLLHRSEQVSPPIGVQPDPRIDVIISRLATIESKVTGIPQVANLEKAIDAVTKVAWLEQRYTQFKVLAETYKNSMESELTNYRTG